MSWSLRILGTNAAVPASGRFPSAQILDTTKGLYLIDCGEGTQMRLSDCNIKRSRIQRVFITHLHGDHFFGLPGLITSYGLYGRRDPLTIHGPVGIQEILFKIVEVTNIHLSYDLIVKEHDAGRSKTIVDDNKVIVTTVPLQHRVPTTGYVFREKVAPRSINGEAVGRLAIPYETYHDLQQGADWISPDGRTFSNAELTHPGREPDSYAYITDTAFSPKIIENLKDVKVLYHESTFLDNLREKASKRGHSTAAQAAEIASRSDVNLLILGHFSSRYQDVSVFETEALLHFDNVIAAREGMCVSFDKYQDRLT